MPSMELDQHATRSEWRLGIGSQPISSTVRESFDSSGGAAFSDLAALATGVQTYTGIWLVAGDVINKITWRSGATAAGTPTHYYTALYSPAGALLQQSADQLSAAWAANTTMDLALAAAVTVTATGWYQAALMVAATTPPSIVGCTLFNLAISTGLSQGLTGLPTPAILAQTSGSALTGTAPATIATPTSVATRMYCIAHS